MGLLSRLFGKRRQASPLESFLQNTTLDSSRLSYRNVSEQDLKLPSAISIWALHISHRFCLGLRKMLEGLDTSTLAIAIEGAVYDSVAVEVAGFCFFYLMNDLLREAEDQEEEDPYLSILKTSATLANSILNSHLASSVDADYLLKRVVNYSSANVSAKTNSLERFAAVLLSSIAARQPTLRVTSPPINLALQVTIPIYIPIFHSTYLLEFKKAARVMYLADREGAL